jgi:hypothetical protein
VLIQISFSSGVLILRSGKLRPGGWISGTSVLPSFPGWVLDAVKHLAQLDAPTVVHHFEIGVVLVDADDFVGLEAVRFVHHQVQRQADRQVRFERGVHRHQRAFGGLVQRRLRCDDTVQHGFAVLGLANWKYGVSGVASMKLPAE